MQNNQSSLQQHHLFDFGDEYQTKDIHLNDINDNDNNNDNYFNQNYAEFGVKNQDLDNSTLNLSQPYEEPDVDNGLYDNQNNFLNTTIHYDDNYYEDDENEIHYLNFIKKAEIAVSQQNAIESKNHRYGDYQQEENLKTYTIVCVDDSRAVVNAIKMYLDDNLFCVVGINDPLKALMQVVRLKPDLILLDITMPTLDGYELCSLLRKHSSLKETPIIMVTGKKGIINRVKAKMVKASDYITKPFQKKDLLKVIFKYIV
ncbi:response regulator containing a CheY-like receiver domain and a GGDEF domain [Rivularia sp. PCC 7116]|uniref:response regulator n=1 Tax=Rivularia sp. PCC 7116 TaxID=373994 RepID=UPI00029EE66E|nr:response regulator containing a CheY-like receiver domain and a GGDEF domain [Rivularia sp. PCC 7116]